MRLGVFGGSFDPVHNGHIALATRCRDAAQLDQVWLMPTATQPFKQHGPIASDADRLAMLQLAVATHPGLRVSTIELERGGVSYTVDTLRQIERDHPGDELFLLMGADSLADLPNWREPAEILRMARPLVVQRPGEAPPDLPAAQVVQMQPMDVSSTQVRDLVKAGEAIAHVAPAAVAQYIQRRRLYR